MTDYKDIADRMRKWANGDTCTDCPAKDDLAFLAADAITTLLAGLEPEDSKKAFNLRELAQADREGRCVVLPCKPSDVTVYQLRNKKHARGVGVSPRHVSCASVWANGNMVSK